MPGTIRIERPGLILELGESVAPEANTASPGRDDRGRLARPGTYGWPPPAPVSIEPGSSAVKAATQPSEATETELRSTISAASPTRVATAARTVRLHWRIRCEGLLAHAAVEVTQEAVAQFRLTLDRLVNARTGQARLVCQAGSLSELAIYARGDDVAQLTILACPPPPLRGRVLIEALELTHADLARFKAWADDCWEATRR